MSATARHWEDLTARLATAVVLAVVGIGAVWMGSVWLMVLCAFASGLMTWELGRMISPEQPLIVYGAAALAGLSVFGFFQFAHVAAWTILLIAPVFGFVLLTKYNQVFAVYCLSVVVTGVGLIFLRESLGLIWVLWLISVVVATDIGGYFAGRFLGGPKFWPRISPKKTWSGTVAGWIASACVAGLFMSGTGAGLLLVVLSVLISFASQLGDVAESAIKRRTGIKDSSGLLPGHGGVLDRFDGVIGAMLLFLMAFHFFGFPTVIL